MHAIIVEESRCPQNHPCPAVHYCPTGAIRQRSWNSAPEIDREDCMSCGRCINFCGFGVFQFSANTGK
ncbi:MAG: 4Fe-4S binding protein [Bacteroidales bacterium]